jgi:cellulose synthase/poly-beta-1,6-N-acetylglucosamine synthase-like glycosyltransferase
MACCLNRVHKREYRYSSTSPGAASAPPARACRGGPVSVVIPAYNEREGIAATVRSMLDSDYRNLEVIVIDDGSTDGTRELLASLGLPVTIVRQPNAGKATALMPSNTLAADTDLTVAMGCARWRIRFASGARAWTEAPGTLSQLWSQRHRWAYGTLQTLWKYGLLSDAPLSLRLRSREPRPLRIFIDLDEEVSGAGLPGLHPPLLDVADHSP